MQTMAARANAAYDDNLNKDGSVLENGEPWAGLPDATVAAQTQQSILQPPFLPTSPPACHFDAHFQSPDTSQ
ncbi:hypothetical protein BDN70DRAFT_937890 [Pholiota conissans]|uniref:Uncharacterized protein n=1 Tax=Pholiota conissans TaxID=109636 RepID=A0A9P5YPS0_9AGAR|nr:hypothetical protein BDN70DRAFT_937890 [Pholiota conissans]